MSADRQDGGQHKPEEVASRTKRAAEFLAEQKPLAARYMRQVTTLSAMAGVLVIAQAWLIASIVDAVAFKGRDLSAVMNFITALLLLLVLRGTVTFAAERQAHLAGVTVKRTLRRQLVEHLLKIGPVGLAGEPTGRIVAAATDAPQAVEPFFARFLPASRAAVLIPVMIVAAVAPFDWVSALVFLVTAPLIPVFMVLIGAGAERLNQRQWRRLARMSGHFLDAIQGLKTLKVFNADRREQAAIARVSDDYRRDTMGVLRVAFLSSLVLEFFATVSIAIIAVLVGFRLLWGDMTFFDGFFVLLLAPELYLPLRTLGTAYHARMEAIGAAERILAVHELPVHMPANGTRQRKSTGAPAIIFEDVHVIYPDGRQALCGLSFKIAAGERVAIMGPSGAGKSTVLNLLLGFIATTSGRILIDGIPLGNLEREHWLGSVTYLRQQPHLFEATVAQNIAMTLDGPVADPERVRLAATHAFAAEFIERLPDGYDTVIGEHGAGLSGGEAQRISLARAFYRDAPLILIDEAAAHLDRSSEILIGQALTDLARGRTMITVAHRPAGLQEASRILALENGQLTASGTPAELLADRQVADGGLRRAGTAIDEETS
ncbi:MAG: thiol reductant ABC exporter subunit CydD [Hyphomicrobiaceae bacterium]|nr:thiol reductant ABC exporter subunit CydD [Hyphomicrobiaceae bacterium]